MANIPRFLRLSPLASALLLTACASFSPDGGMRDVVALADARTGAPDALSRDHGEDGLTPLLAQPLNADSAVRIALMNNPGMKAALAAAGRLGSRPGAVRPPAQSGPFVRPLAWQRGQ